jgi:DNA invertase Pin-like site-specific DNA recombinase
VGLLACDRTRRIDVRLEKERSNEILGDQKIGGEGNTDNPHLVRLARVVGSTGATSYYARHSAPPLLFERAAGKELAAEIRRGDHVIVAPLDRLSRSFVGFAHILDAWLRLKVVLHLSDMPGGVFDPENPMSEMMIGILIVFANDERRLISQRTREGLAARRQRGERSCRWAEYGRWREKRSDTRTGKVVNVKMPDEREILREVVELRAVGHTLDAIRQHLNYRMKARTRTGGEWATNRLAFLVQQGLRLPAEAEGGDPEEFLPSADADEG